MSVQCQDISYNMFGRDTKDGMLLLQLLLIRRRTRAK